MKVDIKILDEYMDFVIDYYGEYDIITFSVELSEVWMEFLSDIVIKHMSTPTNNTKINLSSFSYTNEKGYTLEVSRDKNNITNSSFERFIISKYM